MKQAHFSPHPQRFLSVRLATTIVFFINGLVFSSWVSRIPTIQQHLELSTGPLGLALWAVALGALLSQPFTGWFVSHLGSRMITRITLIFYGLSLLLPAFAINLPTLMLALFMLGATNGMLDVAMNAQGVLVERTYSHPIFSSFHAALSLGGLFGSMVGGILASFGVTPLLHFGLITLLTMSIGMVATRWLLPTRENDVKKGRGWPIMRPRSQLLLLSLMAFCALLGEGAVADWSAVYLHGTLHVSTSLAAGGFAAFSLTMACGRLIGDHMTCMWGPVIQVRRCGLLAIGGLGLTLVIPHPFTAILGYALFGIGLSCIVPIVLSAAGHLATRSQEATAIAMISTIGYTGFLTGPPMIGFLAEYFTLHKALLIIVVFTSIIVLLARSTQKQEVF